MKLNQKLIVSALTFAVVAFSLSTANAATKPTRFAAFTPKTPKYILKIKRASWRDPLFGDMGWTHSSDWGKFSTTKGKVIKITLITKVPGLHPGITVWHRGANDTAPDIYVQDHFYQQNASISEFGAKDEATGKAIGNIFMRHIGNGYDNDGHTNGYGFDDNGNKILKAPAGVKGIKDKIPGQLVLTFKAPLSGNYQFVVGGFNPIKAFDGKNKHEVTATVSVTP
ncbi:copper(I)-binding protein CorA [Crenothrix sp.]|uniref:copper(I)-binding protein CorA n=1 Tax=Crenothrix sp. TaxID=3100433 RepID=UPI00374CAEEC